MKCRSCGEVWKSARGGYLCPFCGADNAMSPEEVAALFDAACAAAAERRHGEAAEGFLAAAERGSVEACCRYAACLERGIGVRSSPREAIVWLKTATLLGSGEAAGRLWRALSKFKLIEGSSASLELWQTIAAELGDPESLRICGDRFISGSGDGYRPDRALYCYARAAERLGGEGAARKLGQLLSEGKHTKPDPELAAIYLKLGEGASLFSRFTKAKQSEPAKREVPSSDKFTYDRYAEDLFELALAAASAHEYELAVLFYRRSAELGFVRAINCLGVCLERGRGTAADPAEAVRLYASAAESGSALACMNLADCYRRGVGVEIDREAVFAWYMRAAELGNAHAQYTVAGFYLEGKYTCRSLREALNWYEKAALQSHSKAMQRADELRRAITNTYNKGVAAHEAGNYAEALDCYASAALSGHAGALCNLGILYQLGLGCKPDRRAAARCYRESIAEGSDAAAYNLGLCYLKGEGVPYSYREAKHYLTLALGADRESARPLLEQMKRNKKKKQLRHVCSLAATLHYKGDPHGAAELLSIAAEAGSGRACYLLGCHFEFGCGVPSDHKRALLCYDRASELGYTSRTAKGAFLRFTKNLADKSNS